MDRRHPLARILPATMELARLAELDTMRFTADAFAEPCTVATAEHPMLAPPCFEASKTKRALFVTALVDADTGWHKGAIADSVRTVRLRDGSGLVLVRHRGTSACSYFKSYAADASVLLFDVPGYVDADRMLDRVLAGAHARLLAAVREGVRHG